MMKYRVTKEADGTKAKTGQQRFGSSSMNNLQEAGAAATAARSGSPDWFQQSSLEIWRRSRSNLRRLLAESLAYEDAYPAMMSPRCRSGEPEHVRVSDVCTLSSSSFVNQTLVSSRTSVSSSSSSSSSTSSLSFSFSTFINHQPSSNNHHHHHNNQTTRLFHPTSFRYFSGTSCN